MSDITAYYIKLAATISLLASFIVLVLNVSEIAINYYNGFKTGVADSLGNSVYESEVTFPVDLEMSAPEAYKYYMASPDIVIGIFDYDGNEIALNSDDEPEALITDYAVNNAIFKVCTCSGSKHQFDLYILKE